MEYPNPSNTLKEARICTPGRLATASVAGFGNGAGHVAGNASAAETVPGNQNKLGRCFLPPKQQGPQDVPFQKRWDFETWETKARRTSSNEAIDLSQILTYLFRVAPVVNLYRFRAQLSRPFSAQAAETVAGSLDGPHGTCIMSSVFHV